LQWLGVAILSLALPRAGFVLAAVAVLVLSILCERVSESLLVGPLRRDFPVVEDGRGLIARFKAVYLANPHDRLVTGLGYAAAVLFLILAATVPSSRPTVVGAFGLPMTVIAVGVLLFWRSAEP
jgi:hypothetical protein